MKSPNHTNPYPVGLLLKGRRCIVVGGGSIGARKALTLLEHGAVVTVVSPILCPELRQLWEAGEITYISRCYTSQDVEGMYLVIAATDDISVNMKISSDAHGKRILVNVVDNEELSDFILPAFFCRGNLIVTVATAGQSPALARKIKESLQEEFGPGYSVLVNIVGQVRQELKKKGKNPSYPVWKEALDIDLLLDLINKNQFQAAKDCIQEKLRQTRGLV